MSEGLELESVFSSDEAETLIQARRHWLILPPPDAAKPLPLISLPPLGPSERETVAVAVPYPPA